jgi:hypothetical protein
MGIDADVEVKAARNGYGREQERDRESGQGHTGASGFESRENREEQQRGGYVPWGAAMCGDESEEEDERDDDNDDDDDDDDDDDNGSADMLGPNKKGLSGRGRGGGGYPRGSPDKRESGMHDNDNHDDYDHFDSPWMRAVSRGGAWRQRQRRGSSLSEEQRDEQLQEEQEGEEGLYQQQDAYSHGGYNGHERYYDNDKDKDEEADDGEGDAEYAGVHIPEGGLGMGLGGNDFHGTMRTRKKVRKKQVLWM